MRRYDSRDMRAYTWRDGTLREIPFEWPLPPEREVAPDDPRDVPERDDAEEESE